MPTTKKPTKPATKARKPTPKPAPAGRDFAVERTRRATGKQLNLSLTDDERATLDALAAALEAPLKASILSAARAALLMLTAPPSPYPTVRRELRADLEPAKPGPKVADE